MPPKVLNKKTDDIPDDAVYVGRPSRWGNPFVIGEDGDRDEVIAKYERHLMSDVALLYQAKLLLPGKDLVCWCAPQACHADVLLRVVNDELE